MEQLRRSSQRSHDSSWNGSKRVKYSAKGRVMSIEYSQLSSRALHHLFALTLAAGSTLKLNFARRRQQTLRCTPRRSTERRSSSCNLLTPFSLCLAQSLACPTSRRKRSPLFNRACSRTLSRNTSKGQQKMVSDVSLYPEA